MRLYRAPPNIDACAFKSEFTAHSFNKMQPSKYGLQITPLERTDYKEEFLFLCCRIQRAFLVIFKQEIVGLCKQTKIISVLIQLP